MKQRTMETIDKTVVKRSHSWLYLKAEKEIFEWNLFFSWCLCSFYRRRWCKSTNLIMVKRIWTQRKPLIDKDLERCVRFPSKQWSNRERAKQFRWAVSKTATISKPTDVDWKLWFLQASSKIRMTDWLTVHGDSQSNVEIWFFIKKKQTSLCSSHVLTSFVQHSFRTEFSFVLFFSEENLRFHEVLLFCAKIIGKAKKTTDKYKSFVIIKIERRAAFCF